MASKAVEMMSRKRWLAWVGIFAVGIIVGSFLFGGRGGDAPGPGSSPAEREVGDPEVWTCSMHPQVKLPEAGKCPICFMDLIPLDTGDGEEGPTQLSMSEESMKLAEVVTTPATRQFVEAEVRAVGKVAVDERRLKRITAWVGGRLDRLFVDYTGVTVKKGDHLVEIYSPELYSAQVELTESLKAREDLRSSNVTFIRETAEATVKAAREKLRLLGLQPAQIEAIEASGTPDEHVTVYAPIAGIVVHKSAVEGEYVKPGSPIYTIAELSQVWVMLDIYESDLVWVHYGERMEFEVEAFPGETFEGRIAFIDPVVDPQTRTVKVRVNAENPRLRLKPNMFVRAVIRSKVIGDGRTLAPDLAGKWISPMHPEIVKDHPGTCDICGMALVPASQLGFVTDEGTVKPPLIIPASAPLITGKRAVVYVRVPGTKKPTFEGREIVIGPRAGDFYVVASGLTEGEEVVVKGNFKIDSAMQIQAKPSMMSPEGGAPAPGHRHGPVETQTPAGGSKNAHPSGSMGEDDKALTALENTPAGFRNGLSPLYTAYFSLQAALAADELHGGHTAVAALKLALDRVPTADLDSRERQAWESRARELGRAVRQAEKSTDLSAMRTAFDSVTGTLLALDRTVGPPAGEVHRLMFCPMAFQNRGAYWLQQDTAVRNPYFGASMLKCGEVRETFDGSKTQ